ncbi:MAG: zinc-ribbon domain containing protein [Planctomycetes bacterium]|nr:zinc-ribbon domain containing protein [Planctomycetota bacterium]
MPDIELVCQDCNATFVFTDAEQQYFQAQGFVQTPKRCKACRAQRRQGGRRGRPGEAQRIGGNGPSRPDAPGDRRPRPAHYRPIGGAPQIVEPSPVPRAAPAAPVDGASPRPPRPPRGPMHQTVCSGCGEPTEVPFVPDGRRPVFCLPCLKKQTR